MRSTGGVGIGYRATYSLLSQGIIVITILRRMMLCTHLPSYEVAYEEFALNSRLRR